MCEDSPWSSFSLWDNGGLPGSTPSSSRVKGSRLSKSWGVTIYIYMCVYIYMAITEWSGSNQDGLRMSSLNLVLSLLMKMA